MARVVFYTITNYKVKLYIFNFTSIIWEWLQTKRILDFSLHFVLLATQFYLDNILLGFIFGVNKQFKNERRNLFYALFFHVLQQ